jgi:integrase
MGPASLKNVVTALRSFFRYAQFRGEVTAGLALSVPAVAGWTGAPPIPRAILLEAALALPVAWPSTPLRPRVFHCLIGLLSVTGLRISEALKLELGDVDLDDAVLTIRGTKLVGRAWSPFIRPPVPSWLTISGAASSSSVARSRPMSSSRIAEPDSTSVTFIGRSMHCRGKRDYVPKAKARGRGYMTSVIASQLKC